MTKASVPACYLAEQHGANRRDFYFVTEDAAGLEQIARAAAEALSFPLAIERRRLAEVAPIILPTEAIGELGLEVSADARVRRTRFALRRYSEGSGRALQKAESVSKPERQTFLTGDPSCSRGRPSRRWM